MKFDLTRKNPQPPLPPLGNRNGCNFVLVLGHQTVLDSIMRIAVLIGQAMLVVAALISITGCRSLRAQTDLSRFSYAELHMGSVFRIVFYAPDQTTADRAAEAVFQRIAALDELLSDYRPQSEVRRLSLQPAGQPVEVSATLWEVLSQSQDISRRTHGAFDVTIGPMVQLWRQSRRTKTLPETAQIAQAKQAIGFDQLKLNRKSRTVCFTQPGMQLDLGGIAKGYAADTALRMLRSMGIRRAMVAASGDIAIGDPPPGRQGWTIGIASINCPEDEFTDRLLLKNAAISTSGDTEQSVVIAGKTYSHIVDPQTGLGLTNRLGVTVVAKSATITDSVATAVSVLGIQEGLRLIDQWSRLAALIVEIRPGQTNLVASKRFKALQKQFTLRNH